VAEHAPLVEATRRRGVRNWAGCRALKLPYRATSHAPPAIRAALQIPEPTAIPPAAAKPKAALPAASPSLFDLAE
jgi:hypothetical protein